MHYLFPVGAFWLALLLAAGALRARRRPVGRILKRAAVFMAALGGVLFLWWGLERTLANLPVRPNEQQQSGLALTEPAAPDFRSNLQGICLENAKI